jgi:GTP-binding protein YchF
VSLKAGIIGLPNVGKSTVFNAITQSEVLAANYPFATIEPNVGVVAVPDERLEVLTNIYKPKQTIPTTFEFIDIAGLVKGASHGEGLGNKFLAHIRETDAICHVVRCFEDDNITHVEGRVDPVRDIEIINLELIYADLEVVVNRISKLEKKAKSGEQEAILELLLLTRIKETLEQGKSIRSINLNIEEKQLLKSYNLLSIKPIIYVLNVDENDLFNPNDNLFVFQAKEYAKNDNAEVMVICAKIEAELATLSDEEKKELLQELGIKESGLDQLIKATYSLLGLATFFTAGEKEVRAWTFKTGMKAPKCAGIIHSDFERGFICAEVMSYDDLVHFGSEKSVREHGRYRLEGKDYEVQDGDICFFRFNV